jgi:hypothetical protein
MASASGTPPRAESESVDVVTIKESVASSAVSDNVLDAELPPEIPSAADDPSFSAASVAPPELVGLPLVQLDERIRAPLPTRLKLRIPLLAATAALVAAATTIPLMTPRRVLKVLPARAAQTTPRVPSAAGISTSDDASELVAVAATNRPTSAESAELARPGKAAISLGSAEASSVTSKAAAAHRFAEAFQEHAAKEDAKWRELKLPVAGPATSVQPVAPAGSPASRDVQKPGAAHPMDVLKRLEDARKAKRP